MRAYERTHPWITFRVDLRSAPVELWLFLGEARSKCDQIAAVPLQPRIAQHLHQLFLAKGVGATTAIEGNTLTEAQVVQHLEGRLELPPSKQYLAQEVDNIVAACELIARESTVETLPPLSLDLIRTFNRVVLDKLTLEPEVMPGEIRTYPVGVAGYRAAPAEDCEYLLQRLCDWLNGDDFHLPSGEMLTVFAIIKAVLAHVYIAWLHPFGDGNGRTARLIEFRILAAAGFPTPAAHLLSNHYNQTRHEYYAKLRRASESGGNVIPFLTYAVRGLVEELKQQLEIVRRQQWTVAWRDYLYERFQNSPSAAAFRRRTLVLALTDAAAPVSTDRVRELTPAVALLYARKTTKTLSRDLSELIQMGLIEKSADGYRARTETILAFLPLRRLSGTPALSAAPAAPSSPGADAVATNR